MNSFFKKALIIVSVSFNVIFITFMIFAFTRKMSSLSFFSLETEDTHYTTGACIVSVPANNTDLTFGPPNFSLKPGETAALQFSLVFRRQQMNLSLEPLYDQDIIAIERTGFGIIIIALNPGETTLQTMTGDGIKNIAIVTVTPFYE